MSVKLHNIPKANTAGKSTNVVIEHGSRRCVFHRINNSNIIQVSITPNIEQECKVHNFMLTINEFDTVFRELDLEEIKEESWVE